jgi:hypothetical protein
MFLVWAAAVALTACGGPTAARPDAGPTGHVDAGAPADAGSALPCAQSDGLYCGGHGVVGTAGTLYQCSQERLSAVQVCASGCDKVGTGGHDQCLVPGPTCPNGDGNYCSGDGHAGQANTLYQCAAGAFSVLRQCAYGCQPFPPGGSDRCAPPPTTCPNGDGLYCGGDGNQADPHTLYECVRGVLTARQLCMNGCQATAPGGSDQCAPAPPTCPNGAGLYCGGDGNSGDPNTLYQCSSGVFAPSTVCAHGCSTQAPGGMDQCAPAPPTCPNGDGLYCGGDSNLGDSMTLYQCTAGTFTSSQVCTNGCQATPPGGSDQCAPPPLTCPNGDGLYCGGNGTMGDSKTLYQCTAGTFTSSQVCTNGCQATPPGGSDQCAPVTSGPWTPGSGKPPAKGLWIWYFDYTGMTAAQAAQEAANDGVGYVLIKSGQDGSFWGANSSRPRYTAAAVQEFTSRGMAVFAWAYVTPDKTRLPTFDLSGRIDAAVQALNVPGTSGMILDVEVEFEGNYATQAQTLCDGIRQKAPGAFLGYTSFGWVGYHSTLPFSTFDQHCGDGFFPQVYWSDRQVAWDYGYNQAVQMISQAGLTAPVWMIQSNDSGISNGMAPSTADLVSFYNMAGPYSSLWEFPTAGATSKVAQMASLPWKN